MRDAIKKILRFALPSSLFALSLNWYHFLFSWLAALWYGFPSKRLFVIGVTGTKGKSSTVEMINAILEEAGFRTAIASTIRFKIDKESEPNLFKMTMPGRGYLQTFLARARKSDCTHAVIEITSEGARQYRHAGIALHALIFTNIAREHIESHGSFENYQRAKLAIGKALVASSKRPRYIVANADDELGKKFLALPVEKTLPFRLKDAEPYRVSDMNTRMTFGGSSFEIPFPGTFTILNALAAATLARELGIPPPTIAHALANMKKIAGRAEAILCGQEYLTIVDYAHTPDSLLALYEAFAPRHSAGPKRKLICVLGNTGGGRDRWKRPEMGAIADSLCETVILTNEDPYDEDPRRIVEEMARGMSARGGSASGGKQKLLIIMDRREAIQRALQEATLLQAQGDKNVAVLITGKGTDPFIMEANGTKTPWSDASVVREELKKLGFSE
ncbi:MAG TPA: UDP-N-acetylmuramyl-tripeptide synthetase [Candidatus Paceibacterota bacterium]